MGKPLILIVRDGWGIGDPNDEHNAVAKAKTPVIDRLLAEYPHTRLLAMGPAVGLVPGAQGSSEVGHLNLGAGRVVEQEQVRINKMIDSGSFFQDPKLLDMMAHVRDNDSALHIMGLVQDQGVHALDAHAYALLKLAAQNGLEKVFVHAFTDGRDTAPRSAKTYLANLEKVMADEGAGRVASVVGRYYAMDRDNNWERVQKAYDLITQGKADHTATNAQVAIDEAYARADAAIQAAKDAGEDPPSIVEIDEFIEPTMIVPEGEQPAFIRDGDGVVFFNYRQDRAIQLTKAFVEDDFNGFKREARPKVKFLGLTRYYDDFEFYVVPPMNMHKLLGEVLAEAGLWQLRISETQKFAHVTSFFNGKAQEPFPGEERILIDSYKVPENEKPRMRADKIAEIAEIAIRDGIAAARKATEPEGDVHLYAQHGFDEDDARLSDTYDVFIMNFVNGDMVGHTGVFDAVVAGVEAVDDGVGRVVDAALARGGIALVTADHGNADEMLDHATGKVKTSHTLNPVEFILVSDAHKHVKMREGALGNVAPTMLQLLGLPQPAEMTSESLIESE
ncbi:MAG: 2,3-bisphosphoglycerate-independent phosphoglycerate mutase [Deltaproteobacteria bacterium]|nr:2,3-bisphosphoglycerate-independent phosphoglycerate mutase [Deltaproteobacteria bacterium]